MSDHQQAAKCCCGCSADGDEGGRHQIIKATVGSDGNLYILKFQAWPSSADAPVFDSKRLAMHR